MNRLIPSLLSCLILAACGSAPPPRQPHSDAPVYRGSTGTPPAQYPGGGGYYKDDGPGSDIPTDLDRIPDAVPRWEPLHRPALRPYEVFGKRYVPNTSVRAYRARGVASWYGKKFHGQQTSIGEPYDMYAMTAAHTTLALPSYVRVTNLRNGRSVVVRVIDRGPFHADRLIDLSYAAAHRLDLIRDGSGEVEVEAVIPGRSDGTTFAAVAPPAAPRPAMRPASSIETSLPPGIYLQLGAFGNADNADNLKLHLERELDWLAEPMHILRAGKLHRVQVGPYASREAALGVAARIREALGYQPAIVTR